MDNLFTPVDIQTNDDDVPVLDQLVGEGKKFRDAEALAKGKKQSDQFIAQLQRELEEARSQIGKAATLEEVKTQILSQLRPQDQSQQPATPPASTTPDSDLESLVSTLLEKKEVAKKALTNKEQVQEALRSKFGADAALHLNQKAKELSVSLDYLAQVASQSPAAFFRLVGIESTQPVANAPAPRSTQGAPAPQGSTRNKAYYDRLKASDPKSYFSQAVRMQQYKDMMAQGESYYS